MELTYNGIYDPEDNKMRICNIGSQVGVKIDGRVSEFEILALIVWYNICSHSIME